MPCPAARFSHRIPRYSKIFQDIQAKHLDRPLAVPMAEGASDLVSFNVGGKIYTVLREPTLSLHPTSLLTQLAEDKQDEKEIFVEGLVRVGVGDHGC